MGLSNDQLKVVGGDGYGEFMIDIAGDALVGTYWITHVNYYDPNMRSIFAEYQEVYKEEAKEFGNVTLAYDLSKWVANAIERAGAAEGPAIAKALEETKGLKLTHFTLTIDPANHNPLNKPGIILTIGEDLKSGFFKEVAPE
jgi:branched-chain amino acid transport system substrate-binding protein